MNTCPIQIIDEKNNPKNRWITFDKYIHRSGNKKDGVLGTYDNIVGYCRDSTYNDIDFIRSLVLRRDKSYIYENDIIRNPTLEELKEINAILKKSGYRLNLKTYQLMKKGNDIHVGYKKSETDFV